MDIMRRRVILLSLLMAAIGTISANAAVTPEQLTDPEFVVNQGYSQLTAEDVYVIKNRAGGKPIEPLYNKKQNVFVRGWKAFWGYVDPANDEYDRIHHDVKPSPSFSDL